ncbi:MMPL family transporter [Mesonia aquimarina]|uniref:MMPL family transporter n=1 Tax=Mesonia aquimarina TaxID=1504967 RepID=UPI000EF578BD|nr:MMPL family transporter [Mesonia aquimarina]
MIARFFINTFQKFQQYKIIGFLLLLIFLLVASFGAFQLNFKEDIAALIPKNEKAEELQKILNTVDFSDKIIVNFSAESKPQALNSFGSANKNQKDELVKVAQQFLDSIVKLQPAYIEKIQGKVSSDEMDKTYAFVQQNLPLFLAEEDYKTLERRITKDSLAAKLKGVYKSLLSPAGSFTKKYLLKDPLQITPLGLEKLKQLRVGEEYQLYQNFLLANSGRNLLLFISPSFQKNDAEKAEEFVEKLTELSIKVSPKNNSIKIHSFGSVFYSVANAKRIKADIQWTLGIALSILLVLLIYFYRKIYIPLILFLPSIFGAISALAMLFVFQQEISLIALGIGAVLLGISLDYGLHVLTHYRNYTDIKKLYQEVSSAILMSSLTTATAFFCLLFVESEALNDLGVFAGISVIIAAVFSLLLIPQFYQPKKQIAQKNTFIDRLASFPFEKSNILLIVLGIALIFGAVNFYKVGFEENLSSLNYEPKSLQQAKEELSTITYQDQKTLYLISHGNSLSEALATNALVTKKINDLQEKDEILSFSSVGGLVLSREQQLQKLKKWDNFWSTDRKKTLQQNLIEEGKKLGFKASTFSDFFEKINQNYQPISLAAYKVNPNFPVNEFISENGNNFHTVLSSVKLSENKIEAFKTHFNNQKNLTIIDRQALNQNLFGGLKMHFNSLILYSFGAIFLLLLVFYKNIRLSLITLLPIGITWIIAMGMMYLFNIQFNIFNVIISTFIFGLGVDYSIFVTNALRHKQKDENYKLQTHKTSIILSVFTTLLGMGALIFAVHPALKSVAIISIIGILTAVLVSFCIQPFIFKLLMNFPKNND